MISYSSAGGIIALGLGVKQMPVKECREMFYEFVMRAFARGPVLKSIPFVCSVIEICKGNKYKSKNLNEVLKDQFGADAKIFGECNAQESGTDRKMRNQTKVGVTLSSSTGHSCLVTNYSRPTEYTDESDGTKKDDLIRI